MAVKLTPVDYEPFDQVPAASQPTLTPVQGDPFAGSQPDYHAEARAYLDAHPEVANKTGHELAGKFFQGATLGFGDEGMAGIRAVKDKLLHGGDISEHYAREKAMQDELMKGADQHTGLAGTALQIGGSLMPGGLIAKGVGSVVANPLAQSVATGAGMGGIQSAGDDENILGGMAGGAAGGALGYGAGKLIGKLATGAPKTVEPPSTQSFKDTAQSLYDQFENAGGRFTKEGADALKLNLSTRMQQAGYVPGFSPKVDAVLKAVDTAHDASMGEGMTPRMMQVLRQAAGKVRNSIDPTERSFGHELVGGIDDFITNAQPHHYSAPNPNGLAGHLPGVADLSQSLSEANKNYTTFSKADLVDQALKSAQDTAERTYSGGNVQNTIAQKVGKLAERRRDWTPAELAAIDKVSKGVPKPLRVFGKMAPDNAVTGLGNIALGVGTGGSSVPFSIGSYLAKQLGNRMQTNNVSALSKIIRNGGAAPQTVQVTPSAIEAFISRNPTLLGQMAVGAQGE